MLLYFGQVLLLISCRFSINTCIILNILLLSNQIQGENLIMFCAIKFYEYFIILLYHKELFFIYILSSRISCTTSGFNSVLVSPKLEVSLHAIFLRMRLMIFPERVFGKPCVN